MVEPDLCWILLPLRSAIGQFNQSLFTTNQIKNEIELMLIMKILQFMLIYE